MARSGILTNNASVPHLTFASSSRSSLPSSFSSSSSLVRNDSASLPPQPKRSNFAPLSFITPAAQKKENQSGVKLADSPWVLGGKKSHRHGQRKWKLRIESNQKSGYRELNTSTKRHFLAAPLSPPNTPDIEAGRRFENRGRESEMAPHTFAHERSRALAPLSETETTNARNTSQEAREARDDDDDINSGLDRSRSLGAARRERGFGVGLVEAPRPLD